MIQKWDAANSLGWLKQEREKKLGSNNKKKILARQKQAQVQDQGLGPISNSNCLFVSIEVMQYTPN